MRSQTFRAVQVYAVQAIVRITSRLAETGGAANRASPFRARVYDASHSRQDRPITEHFRPIRMFNSVDPCNASPGPATTYVKRYPPKFTLPESFIIEV